MMFQLLLLEFLRLLPLGLFDTATPAVDVEVVAVVLIFSVVVATDEPQKLALL